MYCPESVYKTSIYHVNPRYEYEGNGSNKRCGAPEIHYGAHLEGQNSAFSAFGPIRGNISIWEIYA
jgi:hypothetical protein